MNRRILYAMFVSTGLTLASAAVLASQDGSGHPWHANHEDCGDMRFERHLSRLHDALKLTAAQEPAWTEFTGKMKPGAMDQTGMKKAGHPDWAKLSVPDRLDQALEHMKSREQELAGHAAAVRTFYGTLTPEQQTIFDQRFQAFRHRHDHHLHDDNHAMRN